MRRRSWVALCLAALAALALAGARYTAALPSNDPGLIHHYNGARGVRLAGRIVADPQVSDRSVRYHVQVEELTRDGESLPVEGIVMMRAARFPLLPYGAAVEMIGDLQSPAASDSGFADYLARRHIYSEMSYPQMTVVSRDGGAPFYRAMWTLKQRAREVIGRSLPGPAAALLTGILLGDDSGVSPELQEAFRNTGMTHIIAISGFNIALLVAALDQIGGAFLPRRPAALLAMGVIALYVIFVGAPASAVRAAFMGAAYLVSIRLLGRPVLVFAPLLLAAVLMTLWQPMTLWDVGFQLSFAATLGLLLYVGPVSRRLDERLGRSLEPTAARRVGRLVADLLIVTLAAQVLVLPLLAKHFGRISLIGLPANLLVLPAQPGVMATGLALLLAGFVSPLLGQAAGWVAWPFLGYTAGTVSLLAEIPGVSAPFQLSWWGVVAAYGAIGVLTWFALVGPERRRQLVTPPKVAGRGAERAALVAGLALLLFVGGWAWTQPDGLLHVAFLDVGQGDAVFIQTPGGRQVLVDGGRYPTVLLERLSEHMPFWDRSLDVVVATHADDDHIAGLVEAVDRYRVTHLIGNGQAADDDPAYAALLAAAAARGVTLQAVQAGQVIDLGDGVRLEALHPPPDFRAGGNNERSVVMRLSYGAFSALLTGDAEAQAEETMLDAGRLQPAVVLKAGHHGAATSSGQDFLQAVRPQIVVISAGADNRYGHPSPEMLERAAAVGATVLRTDQMGTIEVMSNGREMWWQAGR